MRFGLPLLLLAVASSAAHADNGLSLELGYLRNRVAVTDQTALGGELVIFGGEFLALSLLTGR